MEKNLRKEALAIARAAKISVLSTTSRNIPWARFMEQAKIDDDFSLWYATALSSAKVKQIKANHKVCALIFKEDKDLRIFGYAKIITDKRTKYSLWQNRWQVYFAGGKDDPQYTLLKITPQKIEYRNRQKFGHIPKII